MSNTAGDISKRLFSLSSMTLIASAGAIYFDATGFDATGPAGAIATNLVANWLEKIKASWEASRETDPTQPNLSNDLLRVVADAVAREIANMGRDGGTSKEHFKILKKLASKTSKAFQELFYENLVPEISPPDPIELLRKVHRNATIENSKWSLSLRGRYKRTIINSTIPVGDLEEWNKLVVLLCGKADITFPLDLQNRVAKRLHEGLWSSIYCQLKNDFAHEGKGYASRRCWGFTQQFHRCGRIGKWRAYWPFCADHNTWFMIALLGSLLLTALGATSDVLGLLDRFYSANTANVNPPINYSKSADYKDILEKVENARLDVKEYPENPRFQQKLKIAQQQEEDFKRDVRKLAEDFNKIPINTELLRLAKELFDKGEYQAARDKLDAKLLEQEQTAIIDEGQRFQDQQAEKLNNNATAFIFKAKLTAIDYSLPDRIEQTSQFFESALKSARTPENVFEYARFLQENNQFSESEKLYTEALESYRQLAKDKPGVYLANVAMTLNNLGILVKADSSRRAEAEKLYTEALEIHRQLARENHIDCLSCFANNLNNLGNLVSVDSSRRAEAEKLYAESLGISRELATDNPVVYSDKVAMTLYNLGNLVSNDSSRRAEAEKLYAEALEGYQQLAKSNPGVYSDKVAMTLNSLGLLISVDSSRRAEAGKLYTESLGIRRQLAKSNPGVYLADLAMTLNNLGVLVSDDSSRRAEAEKLFAEALEIRRKLAHDNPAVYLDKVANTLNNLGLLVSADSSRRSEAEKLYTEALESYRKLAHDNPAVYLPDVAMTLNNLGALVSADNSRRSEVEKLYTEALEIHRQLARENHIDCISCFAKNLNNLGNLVKADSSRRSESEKLYTEALGIRRKLAQDNPSVYLQDLAKTLDILGDLQVDLSKNAEAETSYKEAVMRYSEILNPSPNDIDALFRQRDVLDKLKALQIKRRELHAVKDSHRQLCEVYKRIIEIYTSRNIGADKLAGFYMNLAFYEIFNNSPQLAIDESRKGLELNPSEELKVGLQTNLAHGYLFLGNYEEAKAIYLKSKDKPAGGGKTFKESVLDDFRQFREFGILNPKMEEMEKLMGKQQAH